jgi:hypothetical protein
LQGAAGGALRQRQRRAQALPRVGEEGLVRGALAGRTCRARPDGGYRMAMAACGRRHAHGAAGTRGRRPQPDGSGKELEANCSPAADALGQHERPYDMPDDIPLGMAPDRSDSLLPRERSIPDATLEAGTERCPTMFESSRSWPGVGQHRREPSRSAAGWRPGRCRPGRRPCQCAIRSVHQPP